MSAELKARGDDGLIEEVHIRVDFGHEGSIWTDKKTGEVFQCGNISESSYWTIYRHERAGDI